MTSLRFTIPVVCLAFGLAGCANQELFPREETAASAMTSAVSRPNRPADTQDNYRRELLKSQLRQSSLDLQQASTIEERKSIQSRIALIEQQLELLD